MRVEVADVGGIQPRIGERQRHGASLPLRLGLRQVMGVGRRGIAREFRQDAGTAALGAFPLFQHQHGCTLGQHQAAAVNGKRTA